MKEYNRIYSRLKQQILENYYAGGQKMPPERQLCEQYNISRITARHALRILEQDGLVERVQGKGTFVKGTKTSKIPITEAGFAKSVKKHAPGMSRKLLKNEFSKVRDEISKKLGIDNDQCLIAVRADILDSQVIAFDKAYISPEYSGPLTNHFLVQIDFFEKWTEIEKINVAYYDEEIEAIEADSEISEILNVPTGSAILRTTETYYDYKNNEKAFAIFESFYQGKKIKLTSTIKYKV